VSLANHHENAATTCVPFSVNGTSRLPLRPPLSERIVVPSLNTAPSTVTLQWTVFDPGANATQEKCAPVQDTVAAGVWASADAGKASARSVRAPARLSLRSADLRDLLRATW